MKNPTITCPTCKGTGTSTLTKELRETFSMFDAKSRLTAKQVHETTTEELTLPAVNNRLETLRNLGLLDRVKDGRSFKYFLAKNRTAPKKVMA